MSQAFIIFFHEGSSIIQGIVQKKNYQFAWKDIG